MSYQSDESDRIAPEPNCEVCGQSESECLCADDPRFTFPARLERMADEAEEMWI